jgi:hypothetical protein
LAVNLGEVIVVYRPSKLKLRLVLQLPGQLFLLALKELGPSDVVERPALGDGYQPGARIVGYAGGRPLLEGNLWAMTGGRAGSLTLAVGVIAAMLWVAAVAARYLRSL